MNLPVKYITSQRIQLSSPSQDTKETELLVFFPSSKRYRSRRVFGVTAVWTRERIEPSIEEAATAGEKIMAVNGAVQNAIKSATNPQLESQKEPLPNQLSETPTPDPWTEDDKPLTIKELLSQSKVKGFAKAMPKVSKSEVDAESRAEVKTKTNIGQMTLAEINDYLSDPVLRKQITPQLWHSDYELITDEVGQIIGVKRSPKIEE